MDGFDNITLTIPNAQSASQAVRLYDFHALAFWMPPAWTAAPLAIQLSRAEATPMLAADWWTLTDTLGEVSLPAAAGRVLVTPSGIVLPLMRWLRVVSGSPGAPVAQSTARDIIMQGRRFG